MKHFCVTFLVLALLLFTLSVASGTPTPLIAIKGPRIVIEYAKVQLSCITTNKQKDFQWHFSSSGTEPYQPLSSGPNVTIKPADIAHVGSYRCCVTATLCTNVTLSVLFAKDDFSSLKADHAGAMLDVPSSGTFTLTFHHPPFVGHTYIDHESMVPFCAHFRLQQDDCAETRTSSSVTYSVRNAAMEASGPFNVKLLLNKRLETMRLNILIRGKPIVQMNDYEVFKNSSHINLNCRGHAYHTPNITFKYTPCPPTAMRVTRIADLQRKNCERTITVPQHMTRHTLFNYTTSFDAIIPHWPVPKPGIVSCLASNGEGSAAIETFLFLRNFPGPMYFAIVSPTDVVLYDDTVNITCQADIYNHTDQFTIRHNGNAYQTIGIRHQYAWITSYETHITNTSHSKVTCEANRVDGKLPTQRTLDLSIKFPSKPHIVSVNDTVNMTIPFGATVKLVCDIDGTPTPQIVWFKDETHLQHGQGNFLRVSLELEETQAMYQCKGISRLGRATKVWHIVLDDSMQWLLICGLSGGALLALLVIGTVVLAVRKYRKLIQQRKEVEEQLEAVHQYGASVFIRKSVDNLKCGEN